MTTTLKITSSKVNENATLTTKTAHRDEYTFDKNGTVVCVTDGNQSGTDVFWSERQSRWVFVDYNNSSVSYAERIAAVRLCEGQDPEEGLNQNCLACDLDGPGLWIVDAECEDGYVETIFTE